MFNDRTTNTVSAVWQFHERDLDWTNTSIMEAIMIWWPMWHIAAESAESVMPLAGGLSMVANGRHSTVNTEHWTSKRSNWTYWVDRFRQIMPTNEFKIVVFSSVLNEGWFMSCEQSNHDLSIVCFSYNNNEKDWKLYLLRRRLSF